MEQKTTITTLIFDFGGVLVNLDMNRCVRHFRALGFTDIEQYIGRFGQQAFFLQYERGEIDTPRFREEVRRHVSRPVSDEEIDRAWCSFLLDIPQAKLDLLLALRKHYRVLLLSNTNPLHWERCGAVLFGRNGLQAEDYFDRCYLSYRLGMTKPDAAIFENLLHAEGLRADECLFLDDGAKNIGQASRLGINTYLVRPQEDLSFLASPDGLSFSGGRGGVVSPAAGCVATIGFFDGVHRGHRFVIDRLESMAHGQSLPGLVITFGEHPRKTLQPGFHPALLTTLPEKLSLLRQNGAEACAVLDFTPEMSRMPAFDFMQQVLQEQYGVRTLLMGYDHRFGHDSHDTFDDYVAYGERLGMRVCRLDCLAEGEPLQISSSAIRRALLAGDITQANRMLGYDYFFCGTVIGGFKVGRKIGFPTANLRPESDEKLLPAPGVYAVRVGTEAGFYPGMLNIGTRPTLANGAETSIEVHLIGFEGDLYDRTLRVEFLQRIREERRFPDIGSLIARLEVDKQQAVNVYGQRYPLSDPARHNDMDH